MRFIINYSDSNNIKPADWIDFSYDNWDDYGYKTTFSVAYGNKSGSYKYLGRVQIGFSGMEGGRVYDKLTESFDFLPNGFFSLGTSEDYYLNISELGTELSKKIYTGLYDLAYDLKLFDKYKNEYVVKTSLLRGRTEFSVRQQLNRIAHGGVKLTEYNFKYISDNSEECSSINLEFNVKPDSNPPTNIHVLIGRNGTGKTYLIKNMIKALIANGDKFGQYQDIDEIYLDDESFFANVLCVAFSPFDDFASIVKSDDKILPFSYIGLNKEKPDLLQTILDQFIENFVHCMENSNKIKRWKNTIDLLRSDPTFEESQVFNFLDKWENDKSQGKAITREYLKNNFKLLSSGHKVVLLIITACVDKLEEKSIIFLDEPENHLHPPLLSACIRALSYLLINRNSVAIISTHSPVILQEVPKSCVWKLYRSGNEISTTRLDIETFGATIGTLTREIFGLEVQQSGFNRMLSQEVDNGYSYEKIINMYNGELGEEAMSLLQTLLILKENEDA